MEYVRGVNLETLLAKTGRMTAPRVARIVTQLCEVLQAAHDEGIIHRDLKPANLMITDPDTPKERIKVMDFGLAKLIDDPATQKVTDTNVDFAVGTPGYIAPEQVRGETMDHRGDLYSVGVMMYELLAGRLPFQGANGMDVLLAHATEAPPTFAEIGLPGWVPKEVEALVFDVLAKLPEERPQSARELSERLAAALRREQARAEQRSVSRPTPGPLPALSQAGPAAGSEEIVPLETDAAFRHRSEAAPSAPHSQGQAAAHAPGLSATQTPARDTAVAAPHEPAQEAGALRFGMEAWMPEVIAVRKLRGFVHDCDGELTESTPGLVRVRLGQGRAPAASWFGLARRAAGPIDVELRFARSDARQENKLTIDVRFRPSHPSLLADPAWKSRCTRVFIELRSYLMGGTG